MRDRHKQKPVTLTRRSKTQQIEDWLDRYSLSTMEANRRADDMIGRGGEGA